MEELIVAILSSGLSVVVWHNFIYPWLVKKLGLKPAKIINNIAADVREELLKELKNE